MRTVLLAAALLLAMASLLPLIETDAWWVRVLDFPRIHYLGGLVMIAALYALSGDLRRIRNRVALALMGLTAGYNVYKVYPYTPVAPVLAVAVDSCPRGSRLRVLSANVQMGNRRAEELLDLVRRHEPDLVLAMETDAWWDRRLGALQSTFPHQVDHVDANYFGLHLLSRYPLIGPEVRFLTGQDAPSVFTGVRLPDGARVDVYGIHPRPPTLGQASTWRDAQLLAAAIAAREADSPVVVAGDLNAVPWERTLRRALRVGALLDPRVGRGYLATYDAQQPWLWWPLDQILFQAELALLAFERLAGFGSDHYPILAELCHLPAAAQRQTPPPLEDGDLAETKRTLEAGLRPEALPLALPDD